MTPINKARLHRIEIVQHSGPVDRFSHGKTSGPTLQNCIACRGTDTKGGRVKTRQC